MIKVLNIQGQFMEHSNARIIGNSDGIRALIDLLINALHNGKAVSNSGGSHANPDGKIIGEPDCIFASDGEGYELTVECSDDSIDVSDLDDQAKTNFWNQKENYPTYVYSEVDKLVREHLSNEGNRHGCNS